MNTLLNRTSWKARILGLSALLLSIGVFTAVGGGYIIQTQDDDLRRLFHESQARGQSAMQVGDAIVDVDRALQVVIAASGKIDTRKASIQAIGATSLLDEKVHEMSGALGSSPEMTELIELLQVIRPKQLAAIKAARKDLDEEALEHLREVLEDTTHAKGLSNTLVAAERDGLSNDIRVMTDNIHDTLVTFGCVLGAAVFIGIVISVFAARQITRPLRTAVALAQRIGTGDLSTTITVDGTDEISQLLDALGCMQSDLKKRIEQDSLAARVNGRIKSALDNVAANVMMVNPAHEIRYFNGMMTETLGELLNIEPQSLIGQLLGTMAPDQETNSILERLLEAQGNAQVTVGGRVFEVNSNSVVASDGEVQGTVLEWKERTSELNAEREIESIVAASRAGDLSKRIAVAGKEGFFLSLGEGVNELIDVVEGSLQDIASVMDALSKGDLTHHISADYKGTFGKVKEDVNGTVLNLQGIVGQIRSASGFMRDAGTGVAHSSQDVSQRTSAQARDLNAAATQIDEMTSTVRSHAAEAREADSLAAQARTQAESGGDIVREAVSAMSAIDNSSERIAAIIGVIDEIAFQTNMLALNAAVEAARAGEQGRGFAVVAAEVRNLAQRSSDAAKEISELIVDSVEKVKDGTRLVGNSGEALQEIVVTTKRVSEIVSAMAVAGENQALRIEEVSASVMEMDSSARTSSTDG